MKQRIWLFVFVLSIRSTHGQTDPCEKSATIVVFRTFNLLDFKFSYRLHANDSLLTRLKTHDVLVIETRDPAITFHATTKAPSLNASKKSGYQKRKTIRYPFTLEPGKIYLVKCGFHNIDLFNYPRQPTIRLIKPDEEQARYVKKRFIRKKIQRYLYKEWMAGN